MIKVGIDIGGTFTDFIVISNNKLYKNKVLTSVENPYISFIDGLNEIFNRNQLDKNKIEIIIHGTTLFTFKKYYNDNIVNGCCNISLFDKKHCVNRHNYYNKIDWL